MPRLTLNDYLATRDCLADPWSTQDYKGFSALAGSAQQGIHVFFAQAAPMSPHEARMLRQEMTKSFPSLPQKAGGAAAALRAHLEGQPNKIVDRHLEQTSATFESGGTTRSICVAAVRRVPIDLHRIACVLVCLAEIDTDGKLLAQFRKDADRNDRNS